LLRANDVRGVLMKSVTFAPLTSEVDDWRSTNNHRTIFTDTGSDQVLDGIFKKCGILNRTCRMDLYLRLIHKLSSNSVWSCKIMLHSLLLNWA
jgi:hypothetical protein